MVKVESLTKTFDGFKALDGLNMNVSKGSIYGLVGPNGAGKTTLINHLVGVYVQDAGKVLINEEEVLENSGLKQKIGYIQDDLFYFNQYTIKEMAKFYKDTYENFSQEKYDSLKSIFKIDENIKIKTLSKGMKKQVAFWLVISSLPELIILDEPLDGLDPIMRRKVLKLLINEVEERKVTIIVSSHNLRELEDICDTVGFMDKGSMVLERKLEELAINIHKVQLSLKQDKEIKFSDKVKVKHTSQLGSVKTLILEGNSKDVVSEIEKIDPLFYDIISLTLEEIFIYELGGVDNEVEGILF